MQTLDKVDKNKLQVIMADTSHMSHTELIFEQQIIRENEGRRDNDPIIINQGIQLYFSLPPTLFNIYMDGLHGKVLG
jgi:hypothetical protein